MNALDLLKTDHDRLRELFQKISQALDPAERRKVFDSIREELDAHSLLEENVFYPEFESFDTEEPEEISSLGEEIDEFLDEAYEEHQEMRDILAELDSIEPDDEEFDEKLDELIELAEDHFDAEETELFGAIKKNYSRADLEELGAVLTREKDAIRKAA